MQCNNEAGHRSTAEACQTEEKKTINCCTGHISSIGQWGALISNYKLYLVAYKNEPMVNQ